MASTPKRRKHPRAVKNQPRVRKSRRSVALESLIPGDYGTFEGGPVEVEWLPDGRCMLLLRDRVFHQLLPKKIPPQDPWRAVAGMKTDGASIPPVFWSVIGGPFEGKYRDAAVNHDYECQVKRRAWRDVHLMFYAGMRANDEEPWIAKLMYFAVYFFGPHWGPAERRPRAQFKEVDIARLAQLLQSDPTVTPQEIERLDRKKLLARVPRMPRAVRGAPRLNNAWILPVDRKDVCADVVSPPLVAPERAPSRERR